MTIEREIKFRVTDFESIKKRLEGIGGSFVDKYFEENIVFDDYDNSLRVKRILLRLRKKGDKNILCLKCPGKYISSEDIKVLEEYETEIGHRENFIIILDKLGFKISFKYEKIREVWKSGEIFICLDILPFGDYVEIEGKGDLMDFALKLGLDIRLATTKTYHELNSEIRQKKGLMACDGFTFDDWRGIV